MGEDHIIKTLLAKCGTQTIWFDRFVRGLELRVGRKFRTDQGISIEVMGVVNGEYVSGSKGESFNVCNRRT